MLITLEAVVDEAACRGKPAAGEIRSVTVSLYAISLSLLLTLVETAAVGIAAHR